MVILSQLLFPNNHSNVLATFAYLKPASRWLFALQDQAIHCPLSLSCGRPPILPILPDSFPALPMWIGLVVNLLIVTAVLIAVGCLVIWMEVQGEGE